MVVPFAAGGPTDTVGRLIAERMSAELGQQVIVENVGGAGGTLGAGQVAAAGADGYTILLHHIGMVTSATLYRSLAYKPLFKRDGISAKLLRGAPGTEVGHHTHRGQEFTLVLSGGFSDITGSYGPGDLQIADGTLRHSPIADPGEDCINLAVTTAPLKFENLIQKIAGPLFGF